MNLNINVTPRGRCRDALLAFTLVAAVAQHAGAQSCGRPIAWWSFDDLTGADSSGFAHHGTVANCTPSSGASGAAFDFNGTNSWIRVPHQSSLTLTQAVTIAAWLRIDTAGDGGNVLTKGDECQSEANYNLLLAAGKPAFAYWDGAGSNKYYSATSAILAGSWHHVAARMNFVTKVATLLVDGEVVPGSWSNNPPVNAAPVTSSNPLAIGAQYVAHSNGVCNGVPIDNPIFIFRGGIDEVRLYNRVLTDDQIRALAGNAAGGPFAAAASAFTCPGGTSTFTVLSPQDGPFTYRWQAEIAPNVWCDLTDLQLGGGCVAGSTASFQGVMGPTLTITGVTHADETAYRCIVTNSCGSTTSNPATLTLCPVDFNCDGFVTGNDFDEFVTAFEAGDITADFDGDGFITGVDFDSFVQAFEAGC